MAKNVIDNDLNSGQEAKLSDSVITRWQQLFCYTRSEAISHIQEHRSNYSRERVSDEHWKMIQCVKEANGYDREAYEYEIELKRTK